MNANNGKGTAAIHNSIQFNEDGYVITKDLSFGLDGIYLTELGPQIIRKKVGEWREMTRNKKHVQRGENKNRAVIKKRSREKSEGGVIVVQLQCTI